MEEFLEKHVVVFDISNDIKGFYTVPYYDVNIGDYFCSCVDYKWRVYIKGKNNLNTLINESKDVSVCFDYIKNVSI